MKTPRLSRPSDSRGALLEAALLCFAQYGYEATSIRRVASAAGRNASLIFYHFGSKEGLYREVIRHLGSRFAWLPRAGRRPGRPGKQIASNGGRAPLEALIACLLSQAGGRAYPGERGQDAAVRLWLAELCRPKAETRDLLFECLAPLVQDLRRCIREIRPDLRGPEVDLWGTVVQGLCLGHALMAEVDFLVWDRLEEGAACAVTPERLSMFVVSGLQAVAPAR